MSQLRIANPPVRRAETAPEAGRDLCSVASACGQIKTNAVCLTLGISAAAKPRLAIPIHHCAALAAGFGPTAVAQDMVGEFVAQNDRQLVVCLGEPGQGRADEQSTTIGARVQLIRRVQLDLIAAGGFWTHQYLNLHSLPPDRERRRSKSQGGVNAGNVGGEAFETRLPVLCASSQINPVHGDNQIAFLKACLGGRGASGGRKDAGEVAVQAKAALCIWAHLGTVLVGGMQGPSRRLSNDRAEIDVGLGKSPGHTCDPLIHHCQGFESR